MVLITIVNGVYKPTYNWGAPHCRSQIPLKPEKRHDPFVTQPRLELIDLRQNGAAEIHQPISWGAVQHL